MDLPRPLLIVVVVVCVSIDAGRAQSPSPSQRLVYDKYGALVRGDVTVKELSLVFTGDERGESTDSILDALKQRKIKAGFFVTGNFVRKTEFVVLLKRALAEGHYMGPHSDSHPLYCSWEDRDTSLVTRDFFKGDLGKNIGGLRKLGAMRGGVPRLFIPPYEWYNGDQVVWARQLGVTIINFTPGSGSNRDYAPEGDKNFVLSRRIYVDILAYEKKDPHGLNGFILLLHLGSGRTDPFHPLLGPLCDELVKRGYTFVRIDRLLAGAEQGGSDAKLNRKR
jgi:peptidoglycan/xylan/chitin deacetylase (PgdA/CDA1 family)